MIVYVVWLDGEREFASCCWSDARSRYDDLKAGYGEDRVEMTIESI